MFSKLFTDGIVTCCLVLLLAFGAAVRAGAQADTRSFRLFLKDGTAVATWGEFARVDERVVFTMAMPGADGGAERLQAVTLPASAIDWPKTDEYAVTVRAARYAETQGEADYAALTATVARSLSAVADHQSPVERLQLVEQVRGVVGTWSREHYSYRANDVRQILALLDELVSELRAEAGISQFDLNLFTGFEPPPPPPPLPAPTLVESIQQVLGVAKASDVPADRVALNRLLVETLDRSGGKVPVDMVKRTREAALDAVKREAETDRAYRELAARLTGRAREAAGRADLEEVEKLLGEARRRDERLGKRRPEEMAALLARIDAQLDAARRLRLARDHWDMMEPALRQYEKLVRTPMRQLSRSSGALDAIRRLSGPDAGTLRAARVRLQQAMQSATSINEPPDVATVHATLVSACQLALRAVELRERAVGSGDLQLAWDASSAAAGAQMLLTQARDRLQAVLRSPELR